MDSSSSVDIFNKKLWKFGKFFSNEYFIQQNMVKLNQIPVKLDNDDDLTGIVDLLRLRDRCSECGKNLYDDPQRRSICMKLDENNTSKDSCLIGKEIKVISCNACGIRFSSRKRTRIIENCLLPNNSEKDTMYDGLKKRKYT